MLSARMDARERERERESYPHNSLLSSLSKVFFSAVESLKCSTFQSIRGLPHITSSAMGGGGVREMMT